MGQRLIRILIPVMFVGLFALSTFHPAELTHAQALDDEPQSAEGFYNRGNTHAEHGDFENAIVDYDQAIVLDPQLVQAYNNRGIAYDAKDNMKKACSDWKQACELGLCEDYELAKKNGACK